ncbi:MAG: small-conductance mechanosensitive ion channel [Parcubacteria group bacterium Gr01-1014_66]|nr:MAG: small-conductance mechanosensitive ion channel [Parcubacteria group bacterium Gr01-1014_66]
MVFQRWGDAIVASLQEALISTAAVIPLLIGAIIVLFLGWVVAVSLGKVVEHLIKALRIDQTFQSLEISKAFEKAGVKVTASGFIGGLVKWFLLIVFMLAASNILELDQVSQFLRDVLAYIPHVVVSAFIVVIAALVSDVIEKLMRGTVHVFGAKSALAGIIARWSIWIFAFIAILLQLRIAPTLIETLVTGFVGAAALALGLSFGLGGKDVAASILMKVRDEMR